MKTEDRDKAVSGPKENTDDYNNEIQVGSGIEGSQDNGASTLRELKRKHAGKTGLSTRTRRPLL